MAERDLARAPTRARWTCCSRPASASRARCARWRSTTSAARRSRFTGSQAGIVTDTLAHEGAHPRRPRRPHPRGARRGQDRARRRLPGRLDRHATSPRSAAAARTPPRSRSPPRSAPRCARSTPTSPASSPPTRGSSRTRASCRSSRSRRCSRCRRPAPGCCSCARSSTPATTASASTAGPSFSEGSGTFVVGEEETMERPPDHRRDPLDRRGARHAARRPGPAGRRRPHLHARWPTPTSTST